MSMDSFSLVLRIECDNDGYNEFVGNICGALLDRSCQWLVYDLCAALHSGNDSVVSASMIVLM